MTKAIERIIPWKHKNTLSYAEHLVRYIFACQFVKGKKVLDAACGTGYGSALMARKGAEHVTGLDKSQKAIAYSAKHYSLSNSHFIKSDALIMPFDDNQFDLVVSYETIEHLENHDQFLKEIKRILNPDGFCIISTPNPKSDYEQNPFHLKELNKQEFMHLLRKYFKHVKISSQANLINNMIFSENDKFAQVLLKNSQKADYFIALASNKSLPKTIAPFGITSPEDLIYNQKIHIRNIEAMFRLLKVKSGNKLAQIKLERQIEKKDLKVQIKDKDNHIKNIEKELKFIKNSKFYFLMNKWHFIKNRVFIKNIFYLRMAVSVIKRRGIIYFAKRAMHFVRFKWRPITDLNQQYKIWIKKHQLSPKKIKQIQDQSRQFEHKPLISIIMPVYNVAGEWLIKAIESVRGQYYQNWELCIVDDASTKKHIKRILRKYANQDQRIKVGYLKENQGISGASNAALSLAKGEFIGLLDNDDELSPDALYEVVKLLNQHKNADMIYSDEDHIDMRGQRVKPYFKPDWSLDMFLSNMYTCHLGVYRKSLIDKIGGFRNGYDGAQDYDLVLRLTEKTNNIYHIPKILYHWREIQGSTSASSDAKPYVVKYAKRALRNAMQRRNIKAKVLDGKFLTSYRIKRDIAGNPMISIIIPTKDAIDILAKCVESIKQKTSYKNYEIIIIDNNSQKQASRDYFAKSNELGFRVLQYKPLFNFAAINNYAVGHARGEHILFLNNDMEVIKKGWLKAMLEHSQREEVGAVGAKLIYPDERIQHAGIIMGIGGVAGHGHKLYKRNSHGYFGSLDLIRNYSGVTAACLMMRKKVFEEVMGMEENLPRAFNDVDLCLKLRKAGYLIVYTPYSELYHFESYSRPSGVEPYEIEFMFKKWGQNFLKKDLYYNLNLTLEREDFSLRI